MRAAVLAIVFTATASAADAPKPATADDLTKTLNAVVKLSKAELGSANKVFEDAIEAGKKAKSPTEVKKIAGQAWLDLTEKMSSDQKKELDAFLEQFAKERIAKIQKYQQAVLADARGDQAEQQQDAQRQAALRKAKTPAERNRIQQQIEQDKQGDKKEKESDKKRDEEFKKRVPKDDLFDVLVQMKLNAPKAPKPAPAKPDAPKAK